MRMYAISFKNIEFDTYFNINNISTYYFYKNIKSHSLITKSFRKLNLVQLILICDSQK